MSEDRHTSHTVSAVTRARETLKVPSRSRQGGSAGQRRKKTPVSEAKCRFKREPLSHPSRKLLRWTKAMSSAR